MDLVKDKVKFGHEEMFREMEKMMPVVHNGANILTCKSLKVDSTYQTI